MGGPLETLPTVTVTTGRGGVSLPRTFSCDSSASKPTPLFLGFHASGSAFPSLPDLELGQITALWSSPLVLLEHRKQPQGRRSSFGSVLSWYSPGEEACCRGMKWQRNTCGCTAYLSSHSRPCPHPLVSGVREPRLPSNPSHSQGHC